MKRVTLLLVFLIYSLNSYSQSKSTTELKEWLQQEANITYLNTNFYTCVDKILETNDPGGVMNVLLVSLCADENVIQEAEYSDEGVKATTIFNSVIIDTCMEENSDVEDVEGVILCGCQFSQFLKNKVGMKKIMSESYKNSKEFERIQFYCRKSSN